MAFQVHVVDVDLLDDDGNKHNTLQQASIVLTVSGSTAGVVLEFALNGATFTYSEGVEWSNAASDEENARLIAGAIGRDTDSPVVAEWNYGDDFVTVRARKAGRWGEGITAERTAGANVDVGGAGAGPANLADGTGSDSGPSQLQDWLDANVPAIGGGAGERIAGSLKIRPLTTESSAVLVVWEEN